MAETIKEFLVGLGFQVDGTSQRKFTDAIRTATLQADLLARGIEGAAVAIAKAVAQISSGFETIYYTAQRAGTSVTNLRSMTYALSQLGTSAGSAQASLSNFGRRLATDPGAESMLKALGVRTRAAQGKLRDTTKLFEEFGKATQKMPTYQALGYAQMLGVDDDTMRAMREQPDLLSRLRAEQEKYAKSIGLNQEEAAKKGQEFMQSLRRLEMVVTLVSEKILSDLAPSLQQFIDKIIEWIKQNPDAIRDGLIQIGNAAAEFAKACMAIAKELGPVITKIGEMASSITGHGGLQGTMEVFAAFMVGTWALRIVAAIGSVSTAWGLMALRLGLPIAIGALATGHSYQTPEQYKKSLAEDPSAKAFDDEKKDEWRRSRRGLFGRGVDTVRGWFGYDSVQGGAGIRSRARRAEIQDKTNYNFTGDNVNVLKQAAKELGTSPKDLATVISYETGGTFSPKKWGGKGGNYMGLIQFGPEERRKYGANENQTFAEQMPAVVRYLKSRNFKPGMGLLDLYSTINAGQPGRYNASDGNGTVRSHVENMQRTHGARVERFLASGSQPVDLAGAAKDLGKMMTAEEKAAAAKAETDKAAVAKVGAQATETAAAREAREDARIKRWNEVYKATGDATKADVESKKVAVAAPDAAASPQARRPTFAPALSPERVKPLGASTTHDNSRSATINMNTTQNITPGESTKQTADLVLQGQKAVGTFGLDGIKSAIR